MDALPRLVNEQWAARQGASRDDAVDRLHASVSLPDAPQPSIQDQAQAYLAQLCPRMAALIAARDGGAFCAVYVVGAGVFCRRVNTLQSFLEVNRELASLDAGAATSGGRGSTFAATKEAVHHTVELGNKAVVAAGCMVGEHSTIGDKSSVKRAVIGARCKCAPLCGSLRLVRIALLDHVPIDLLCLGARAWVRLQFASLPLQYR
jgi:hypothetical protein